MAIFNSYVKLPEGTCCEKSLLLLTWGLFLVKFGTLRLCLIGLQIADDYRFCSCICCLHIRWFPETIWHPVGTHFPRMVICYVISVSVVTSLVFFSAMLLVVGPSGELLGKSKPAIWVCHLLDLPCRNPRLVSQEQLQARTKNLNQVQWKTVQEQCDMMWSIRGVHWPKSRIDMIWHPRTVEICWDTQGQAFAKSGKDTASTLRTGSLTACWRNIRRRLPCFKQRAEQEEQVSEPMLGLGDDLDESQVVRSIGCGWYLGSSVSPCKTVIHCIIDLSLSLTLQYPTMCSLKDNYITTKRGQATSVHPSSMCFSFFSTWNAWYVAQMMKRSQGHLSLCQRCALHFLYLSLGLDWLRQKPVQPRLYSSVVRPSQVWNNKRTHRLTELQLFPQNPSDTRLSKQ